MSKLMKFLKIAFNISFILTLRHISCISPINYSQGAISIPRNLCFNTPSVVNYGETTIYIKLKPHRGSIRWKDDIPIASHNDISSVAHIRVIWMVVIMFYAWSQQ